MVDAWEVVVVRESPWADESNRERALSLLRHEASLCKCCGLPMKVAHDPQARMVVEQFTCRAGRAVDQVRRAASEKNVDSKGNPVPGWDDGLHFFARPYDEDLDAELPDRRRRERPNRKDRT